MRPTDFCHLNDLRVPVPRVFPARYATFIAWTPRGVLGSVRPYQGTECFTTLENASTDRCWSHAANAPDPAPLVDLATAYVSSERGRITPTAPANRSSL
jgi:hypothetical protein